MKITMYKTGFKVFLYSLMSVGCLYFLASSLFMIINNTTTIEIVLGAISAFFCIFIAFTIIREARTGWLSGVIEISGSGVTAKAGTKQCHIDWSDVIMAGFIDYGFKSIRLFIFVRKYRPLLFKNFPRSTKISDDLILVQNRKGLADAVKTYWSGVVVNEDKNKLE